MKKRNINIIVLINILFQLNLFVISCGKKSTSDNSSTPSTLTPYEIIYPNYLPSLEIPANNPMTYEGVALGKKLYYDPILSNNGNSCASCHVKSTSFTTFASNSIPHINEAWNSVFLWKGGVEGTLEDAMHFEIYEFFNTDISKVNNNPVYKILFKQVYNIDEITKDDVAKALAQYFRSLVSIDSRFDQYIQRKTMLTASELNGFYIFNSEKGECFHCHSIGLFQDNAFHNIGLDSVFDGEKAGRFLVSNNPSDLGKFKTPTLRNIELTAPYMHDGRFQTLEQVVEHYNSGVKKSNTLDPIMSKPSFEFGLQLTAQQKLDLISFLKSLTDSSFVNNPNH